MVENNIDMNEFVDEYRIENETLRKYKISRGISSIALFVMSIGFVLILGDLLIHETPFEAIVTPLIGESPLPANARWWGASLILLFVYPFYLYSKRTSEFEIDEMVILYNHFANAIFQYQKGEYDEVFKCLKEVDREISGASSYLHRYREHDIETYVNNLEGLSDSSRSKEIERTFEEVILPICEECHTIATDNRITDQIENIESDGDNGSLELLREVTEEAFQYSRFNFIEIAKISSLAILSLLLGIGFGAGWAVVPLSIYGIYQSRNSKQEG